MIRRIIRDKFFKENFKDDEKILVVAQEMAKDIHNLVEAIANNDMKEDEYIERTFRS